MTVWLAFLRAVNVGKRQMKMAELKALCEELGYGKVKTLLASGNVRFECAHDPKAELEAAIDPIALGIAQASRAVPLPGSVAGAEGEDEIVAAIDIKATAHAAAEAGILALKGDHGATYDSLVLAGSIILHHVGKATSVAEAATQIRAVLDSGRAVVRVR